MPTIGLDELARLISVADSSYKARIRRVRRNINFKFSFNYLVRNLDGFNCELCANHKNTFNSCLDILKAFSSKDMSDISSNVDHSHPISEQELISRGHTEIVNAFRSVARGNYLQIGSASEKTRIFGFMDREEANLFQVCLIDHEHRIYPTGRPRVFRTPTSPT